MTIFNGIAQPPSDTDAFGYYLSGLIDGEGCFCLALLNLSTGKKLPRAEFNIALRADDHTILKKLHDLWRCGNFYSGIGRTYRTKDKVNRKPLIRYYVNDTSALISTVIPFFHRYPLRAKKARDFIIWEEATRFLHSVRSRPSMKKWRPEDHERFLEFIDALKRQRAYGSGDVPLPAAPPEHCPLFSAVPEPPAFSLTPHDGESSPTPCPPCGQSLHVDLT